MARKQPQKPTNKDLPTLADEPDRLRAALGRPTGGVPRPEDKGYAMREIAAQAGVSTSTARPKVQRLCGEGKCIKGEARRLDTAGRVQWTQVYRLADKGKGNLVNGLDRLVAALFPPDTEGDTVREIAERMGMNVSAVRHKLLKLCAEGKCIKGQARRENSMGFRRWITVYRLLEGKSQETQP